MTLDLPPPEADSAAAFVDERAVEAAFDEIGAEVDAGAAPIDSRAEKRQARRERLRLLLRRPGFVIGTVIILVWTVCAIGGDRITPYNPISDFFIPSRPPSAGSPDGHRRTRPRRDVAGDGRAHATCSSRRRSRRS